MITEQQSPAPSAPFLSSSSPIAVSPALLTSTQILEIERQEACHASGSDDLTVRTVHASLKAAAQTEAEFIERMCARIQAADDAASENDYMLDSNDCIRVLRGTWLSPLANDCPPKPSAQQNTPPTEDQGGPDFTHKDDDLNDLLNIAAAMARGAGGMDLGIAFLDALERIEARLTPSLADPSALDASSNPLVASSSTTLPVDDAGTDSPALWTHLVPPGATQAGVRGAP